MFNSEVIVFNTNSILFSSWIFVNRMTFTPLFNNSLSRALSYILASPVFFSFIHPEILHTQLIHPHLIHKQPSIRTCRRVPIWAFAKVLCFKLYILGFYLRKCHHKFFEEFTFFFWRYFRL